MKRIFNTFRPEFGKTLQVRLRVGVRQLLVTSGVALTIVAAAVSAQIIQTPHPNGGKRHSVARAVPTYSGSARAAQDQMADHLSSFPSLTPEQTAPNPPRVSYEGGQLTIIAENSELSDVLSLLSSRTGAHINFPASAAHERIWAGLGPGPARRVLASLLSEIGLNYAIQASDTDPRGIRSVLVSVRTKPGTEETLEQENPPSQQWEASSQVAPEDLRSASAELQPSTETPNSATNEPATSPEVVPVGVQPSLEAAYAVAANQTPYDGVIGAEPNANSAEDTPLAAYTGQSDVVGGLTADVVVYSNGGVLVIIWNDAEDKLLGMPRAIFIGDPSRLPHGAGLSNWK
jgi:hypothetical protein